MLDVGEAAVLVLLRQGADDYCVAVIRAHDPRLNDGLALGPVQIPVTQLHDITGLQRALEYARRSLDKVALAEEHRFSR